jgi:hypothetical protein
MNEQGTRGHGTGHDAGTAPGDRLIAAARRKWAELRQTGPARAARWWDEGESLATRASTRPTAARVPDAEPTRLVRIPSFTDNRPAGDGEARL